MKTFFQVFGLAVAAFAVFVFVSLIGAWFTMYFVNYLFTSQVLMYLFGTAKLGLVQAFVLNVVCGLLFKGYSRTKIEKRD